MAVAQRSLMASRSGGVGGAGAAVGRKVLLGKRVRRMVRSRGGTWAALRRRVWTWCPRNLQENHWVVSKAGTIGTVCVAEGAGRGSLTSRGRDGLSVDLRYDYGDSVADRVPEIGRVCTRKDQWLGINGCWFRVDSPQRLPEQSQSCKNPTLVTECAYRLAYVGAIFSTPRACVQRWLRST
jgi:hypothetical protein